MKRAWMVTVENERHVVELDCDPWFGGRKVHVDKELVVKERNLFTVNEEYRFAVGGKLALLEVAGIIFPRFELFVDGKRV